MKTKRLGCWIVIVPFVLVLIFIVAANAEDGHTHEGVVGKFYSTWKMPNGSGMSCCNDRDCRPAATQFVDGHWEAKRDGDDEWLVVPQENIETQRESPDGRSHFCVLRYSTTGVWRYRALCLVLGTGM
jgi:hypothetical protein